MDAFKPKGKVKDSSQHIPSRPQSKAEVMELKPGALSKKKMSVSSVMTSASQQFNQLNAILSDGKTKKMVKDLVKLAFIIFPPLLATAILAYMNIDSASQIKNDADSLSTNLQVARGITALVTRLAKERGMSCVFLSTDTSVTEKYAAVNATVKQYRKDSDNALDAIQVWLGRPQDGPMFQSKESFTEALYDWRDHVSSRIPTCPQNLGSYTHKIDVLIEEAMSAFKRTNSGPFWLAMESYKMLIRAKDILGLQRAFGVEYFLSGIHDIPQHISFVGSGGAAKKLLNVTGNSLGTAGELWNEMKMSSEIFPRLENLSAIPTDNLLTKPDPHSAQSFFGLMTEKLDLVGDVEGLIYSTLSGMLEEKRSGAAERYQQSIITTVIAGIICPLLAVLYAMETKRMMAKIHAFNEEMSAKTKMLNAERTLSETLLYQMLPISVAKALKNGITIEPEYYDSVTISFSDVIGFAVLSKKSSPLQIVNLLNSLYVRMDDILDQYNVYKVETISDAYMVASGLPGRNGDRHSGEICTMALNILLAMQSFEIPHIPGENLIIRFGVNTGTICTAVVGTKMPRYCLFGDTVNTASRMESSGLGLRIQLSASTHRHLTEHNKGVYLCKYRGNIEVKGKGLVDTYWLIEKKGFPYRVDLENADRIIEETTYNDEDQVSVIQDVE